MEIYYERLRGRVAARQLRCRCAARLVQPMTLFPPVAVGYWVRPKIVRTAHDRVAEGRRYQSM